MRTIADGWRFDWLRDWSGVWDGSFERTWRRMFEASASSHVYHHPSLVKAWADTCGLAAGHQPMFGLAHASSGADVVLPWIISRQRGTVAIRRRLEPAGQDLFGYHDPLTDARASTIDWKTFWNGVRTTASANSDQALFHFVHADFAGQSVEPSSDGSPVLALDRFENFDALLGACSANHRGEVRRRRRRLAERGEISLWVAGAADARQALDDWRSNARGAYHELWADRDRRNTVWRDGFDAFADRVIADGLAGGWAHYAVLAVDGEPIAWHLGLADRERLYWWIPIHRREWDGFAPGKVLLAAIVERLCELRWRELHFLTGAHAYKMAWRPTFCDLRVVRWHARGVRGSALALYDRARATTR